MDENQLTIKGERKEEVDEESKDKKFHRKERRYGTFIRTFSLPEDAQKTGIKANYKDGILSISIPRKEPEKNKPIDINID